LASQTFILILRELEHKIRRKAIQVALYRAIELASFNAIEAGEVAVENHPLAPHCDD